MARMLAMTVATAATPARPLWSRPATGGMRDRQDPGERRDGLDVFFDNVGGEVLNEVLARINLNARIVLCGSISKADAATPQPGPANYSNLVARRARMAGFTGLDYPARVPEAVDALSRWQRYRSLVHTVDPASRRENALTELLRL